MKTIYLNAAKIIFILFTCISLSCNGEDHKKNDGKDSITPDDKTDTAKAKADSIAAALPLDSTKKYVFLTFDDGPQPGTEEVIQALRKNQVKASFFMVGYHATFSKHMQELVDTIRNGFPAILLANHSYTHAFNDRYFNFYHHPEAAVKDFYKAEDSLGATHKIIRLPGNTAWVTGKADIKASGLVRPVCNLLASAGYRVMGWDVEWHFKRGPGGSVPVQSATSMANTLINAMEKHESHTKNCIVLLAHDRMFHLPNNADSLSAMIGMVKAKHPEYIFETIEKYPDHPRK